MINKIEKNTTKKNETEKAVVNESLNNEKNYAKVFLKSIRVSPTKLNLVLSAIRGLDAEQAINYLTFSNKRISIQVKKALQSAIANAENNHQLDVDKLYISEATVGRDIVMKRFRPRARGRGAKIVGGGVQVGGQRQGSLIGRMLQMLFRIEVGIPGTRILRL